MPRPQDTSTGVDLLGVAGSSMELTMIKRDTKCLTDEAESILDRFKRAGVQLQDRWRVNVRADEHWEKINETVDDFCAVAQRINMLLGGTRVRLFNDAIRVIRSFVTHAEELLAEARQENALPPDAVLDNILGVIDRCKMRIDDLKEKRDDIRVVKGKIVAEIADP